MTTENKEPTVEELNKTINDLKTQLGREAAKANTEAQVRVDELTGELEKANAAREEALDVIRGDSDLLLNYQDNQALRSDRVKVKSGRASLEADKQELAKDKLAHKRDIAESNARLRAVTIEELANKYGCNAKFLESLDLQTVTQIENVAIALGAAGKGKRASRPEEPALVIDSGETTGGYGEPTLEQLGKMPMDQYARYVKRRDKKTKGG